MFSYISFLNKSSHPVLVIFLNDLPVEELLLSGRESPPHITDAGSCSVTVADSLYRTLFSLYLPLEPNRQNTLIIEDNSAYLSDHIL